MCAVIYYTVYFFRDVSISLRNISFVKHVELYWRAVWFPWLDPLFKNVLIAAAPNKCAQKNHNNHTHQYLTTDIVFRKRKFTKSFSVWSVTKDRHSAVATANTNIQKVVFPSWGMPIKLRYFAKQNKFEEMKFSLWHVYCSAERL
jgi:hypothetical protein